LPVVGKYRLERFSESTVQYVPYIGKNRNHSEHSWNYNQQS